MPKDIAIYLCSNMCDRKHIHSLVFETNKTIFYLNVGTILVNGLKLHTAPFILARAF